MFEIHLFIFAMRFRPGGFRFHWLNMLSVTLFAANDVNQLRREQAWDLFAMILFHVNFIFQYQFLTHELNPSHQLDFSKQFDRVIFCICLVLHDLQSHNPSSLLATTFWHAAVAAFTQDLDKFIALGNLFP